MDQLKANSNTVAKNSERDVFFSRVKRKFFRHVWLARIVIIGGGLLAVLLSAFLVSRILAKTQVGKYAQFVSGFVFTPADRIKSFGGRANILILGKAGAGHSGGDLTDTLIFVSVSLVKPDIQILSIPRDIWIPAIRAKINSAYFWGNQKVSGGGLTLAKSTVEEVVGQPISYGLVLDFEGFNRIIDVIGGVDIAVTRSFIDEKYPIAGRENDLCNGDKLFRCRYETVKFEQGLVHMNGATALKFVRSRNAVGEEGTDLARGARQDLVIAGVRDKVLTPGVYLSPAKVLSIWKVLGESVETDLDVNALAILARKVFVSRNHIQSRVISEDFLIHPPQGPNYDNQYVFTPKAGNWNEVHAWASELLKN